MEISGPFDPRSALASPITTLFTVTLIIGGVIFLIVLGSTLIAYIRYRVHSDDPSEPPQIKGNFRLEILWTVTPALILAGLFGLALGTMRSSDPPKPEGQQPDLVITGHQWWWEVAYPAAGVVTANEIHIPAGKQLLVEISSADVIHDFWVPQLARKIDATPGFTTYIWLQADEPGTYLGTCSEYCGLQHAWMRIRVIAESPPAFDTWLQQQAQIPATPTSGLAVQGAQLFQSLTCGNCHNIGGTGAKARIGPDLTHLGSRQTLGAGILNNTADELAKWLTNPQAVKPGIHMPYLRLSPTEVNALVAYLESLK